MNYMPRWLARWLSRALTAEDDVMACGERSRLRHLIKCCCAAVVAGGIFPLAAHAQVTAPKMTSAAALLDWLATEAEAGATRVRLSETCSPLGTKMNELIIPITAIPIVPGMRIT